MLSILKRKYIQWKLNSSSSKKRADYYRKHLGIKIGDNIRFTGKPQWGTEPYLIQIGNNVTITQDVSFLTHDGAVGLFREEHPGINIFGRIKIGNNVFLGARSIILPGVTIGNNVIVATGSIVSKDVPSNSVIGGVPAKVLKDINVYKSEIMKKAVFIKETDYLKRKVEILNKIAD